MEWQRPTGNEDNEKSADGASDANGYLNFLYAMPHHSTLPLTHCSPPCFYCACFIVRAMVILWRLWHRNYGYGWHVSALGRCCCLAINCSNAQSNLPVCAVRRQLDWCFLKWPYSDCVEEWWSLSTRFWQPCY